MVIFKTSVFLQEPKRAFYLFGIYQIPATCWALSYVSEKQNASSLFQIVLIGDCPIKLN